MTSISISFNKQSSFRIRSWDFVLTFCRYCLIILICIHILLGIVIFLDPQWLELFTLLFNIIVGVLNTIFILYIYAIFNTSCNNLSDLTYKSEGSSNHHGDTGGTDSNDHGDTGGTDSNDDGDTGGTDSNDDGDTGGTDSNDDGDTGGTDSNDHGDTGGTDNNNEWQEEESLSTKDRIANIDKLIRESRNAMTLNNRLPDSQKEKNAHLTTLRNDPDVQDYYEGNTPDVGDLPYFLKDLEQSKERENRKLAQEKNSLRDQSNSSLSDQSNSSLHKSDNTSNKKEDSDNYSDYKVFGLVEIIVEIINRLLG